MKTVIAICGCAGSGKSSIIEDLKWYFPGLDKIIPYTTRPQRDNEVAGVDFHFVDNKFIGEHLNDIVEMSIFNHWIYCTLRETYSKENGVYIGEFDIQRLLTFLDHEEDIKVIPIYVYRDAKTRLLSQLNREQNPDCSEICRRFLADQDTYGFIEGERDRFEEEKDWDFIFCDNNQPLGTTVPNLIKQLRVHIPQLDQLK